MTVLPYRYLFSFIQKDKHCESLVEKLCHRYRATRYIDNPLFTSIIRHLNTDKLNVFSATIWFYEVMITWFILPLFCGLTNRIFAFKVNVHVLTFPLIFFYFQIASESHDVFHVISELTASGVTCHSACPCYHTVRSLLPSCMRTSCVLLTNWQMKKFTTVSA